MKKAVVLLLVVVFCMIGTALAEGNWVCPSCGHENPARANFCGSCRTEKPSSQKNKITPSFNGWLCPKCYTVNENSSHFCIICGNDYSPDNQPAILVDEVQMTEINLEPVEIIEYKGTLKEQGNKNVIHFTAPVTGDYYVWLKKADYGFTVEGTAKDLSGYVEGHAYFSQGEGLSAHFQEGVSYDIYIEQYQKTGDYTLAIGIPRKCVDIGTHQVINDSLSFRFQKNYYSVTAPRDGIYRFWISQIPKNVYAYVSVLDEGGYIQAKGNLGQNNGISVKLNAGQQYSLHVNYDQGLGDYTLKIGVPQPIIDISGCKVIGDRFYYSEQDNSYNLLPYQTGTYTIMLRMASKGMKVYVKVTDVNGYTVDKGYMSQGGSIKMHLEEDLTYALHVIQDEERGEYVLTIED